MCLSVCVSCLLKSTQKERPLWQRKRKGSWLQGQWWRLSSGQLRFICFPGVSLFLLLTMATLLTVAKRLIAYSMLCCHPLIFWWRSLARFWTIPTFSVVMQSGKRITSTPHITVCIRVPGLIALSWVWWLLPAVSGWRKSLWWFWCMRRQFPGSLWGAPFLTLVRSPGNGIFLWWSHTWPCDGEVLRAVAVLREQSCGHKPACWRGVRGRRGNCRPLRT